MAITVNQTSIGTRTLDSNAANTFVLTTNQTVASGALIVVAIGYTASTDTISSVTDDSGHGYTWTVDKQGRVSGNTNAIASVYATNGLTTGTLITFNLSGIDQSGLSAGGTSFLGVKTTSYIDGTPLGPTDVATQAWSSGNATLVAGSVLVGTAYASAVATSHAATTGTEAWESLDVPDGYGAALVYVIGTSAGTYTVAGSWGSAGANQNIAVAYLAAAGAAAEIYSWAPVVRTVRGSIYKTVASGFTPPSDPD